MSRRDSQWALVAFLVAAQAFAAPPTEFTIQGVLRDGGGALQSVPVNVSASIFDAQTSGTKLAGPYTQNGVPVVNGLFTFTIADPTLPALVGAATSVWVELTVGSDTFARQKVTTTLFSALAGDSAKLGGTAAASFQKALATPDCGAGKHVQGVAANGTVTCAADPTADGTSITATAGVFSVSFAGAGVATTAARSDHTHSMSCTQRPGTANNSGGNNGYNVQAFAQCNAGETLTGGGCFSSSAAIKGSYFNRCAGLCLCLIGAPCPANNSWVCSSTAVIPNDNVTAYAECCTIN